MVESLSGLLRAFSISLRNDLYETYLGEKVLLQHVVVILFLFSYASVFSQQVDSGHIYAYEDRNQRMFETEQKISKFILDQFAKPISLEIKKKIEESIHKSKMELKEVKYQPDYEIIKNRILQSSYRSLYFKTYPQDRKNYHAQVMTMCTNGDFESGSIGYSGQSAYEQDGYKRDECESVGSYNLVPDNIDDPLDVSPHIETFEITTVGLDPYVNINRVHNGNKAIRINGDQAFNGVNVLTYNTVLTSNAETISFSYALVFQNLEFHTNTQPFFHARVFVNNSEQDELCRIANGTDPFYEIDTINRLSIVYSDWVCEYLTINGEIGDNVRIEFTVADCGQGSHWGYAYVDDICFPCVQDPNACNKRSVIIFDAISCGDSNEILVCGSYIPPSLLSSNGVCEDGVYSTMSLSIYEGGSVVNSGLNNYSVNTNAGTFCFELTSTDFPVNSGGYDFEVIIEFSHPQGSIVQSEIHSIPGLDNDYIFGDLTTSDPQCCDINNAVNIDLGYVEARSCDSTSRAYLVTFSFEIPDSLELCPDNDPLSFVSEEGVIEVLNSSFTSTGTGTNILTVHAKIYPDDSNAFENVGIEIITSLCGENGEVFCYKMHIYGKKCYSCIGTLIDTTTCFELSSNNGTSYAYTGSFTLNTLVDYGWITSSDCGISSVFPVGLSASISGGPNQYIVEYSFVDTNPSFTGGGFTICFNEPVSLEEICLDVIIIHLGNCVSDPDCLFEQSPKRRPCTSSTSDSVYYNLNGTLLLEGYHLCDSVFLYSISNGADVNVHSYSVVAGTLYYDISIVLPIDYDQNTIFEFRFFFCDSEGNIQCFMIPLIITCLGDTSSAYSGKYYKKESNFIKYSVDITPNPASEILEIRSELFNTEYDYTIIMRNVIGQEFSALQVNGIDFMISLDVSEHPNGLYFISIRENEKTISTKRIIINH